MSPHPQWGYGVNLRTIRLPFEAFYLGLWDLASSEPLPDDPVIYLRPGVYVRSTPLPVILAEEREALATMFTSLEVEGGL